MYDPCGTLPYIQLTHKFQQLTTLNYHRWSEFPLTYGAFILASQLQVSFSIPIYILLIFPQSLKIINDMEFQSTLHLKKTHPNHSHSLKAMSFLMGKIKPLPVTVGMMGRIRKQEHSRKHGKSGCYKPFPCLLYLQRPKRKHTGQGWTSLSLSL